MYLFQVWSPSISNKRNLKCWNELISDTISIIRIFILIYIITKQLGKWHTTTCTRDVPKLHIYIHVYIYIDWTQNLNSVHCKFIISLRSMTFCQTIPKKLKLFFFFIFWHCATRWIYDQVCFHFTNLISNNTWF